MSGENDLREDASKCELRPLRKVPYALMDDVKAELDSMEKTGIIKRVNEPTLICSQMVVIKQKRKLRICLDPTDLNKILLRRHFPLKTLEEIATQKFLPNLVEKATPLRKLLKKDTAWFWTEEQSNTLEAVEKDLKKVPTLK
ncbi:hypothetical protein MRX96_003603 [Rhipicephalus microplus]